MLLRLLVNVEEAEKCIQAVCIGVASILPHELKGFRLKKKGLFYVTYCNFNFHVFYKRVIFVYVKRYRVEFTNN